MAHSVESRAPFLDVDVMGCARAIPAARKSEQRCGQGAAAGDIGLQDSIRLVCTGCRSAEARSQNTGSRLAQRRVAGHGRRRAGPRGCRTCRGCEFGGRPGSPPERFDKQPDNTRVARQLWSLFVFHAWCVRSIRRSSALRARSGHEGETGGRLKNSEGWDLSSANEAVRRLRCVRCCCLPSPRAM